MQPIIVTTTCGNHEDADLIAKELLEKRLVACAQISGPVMSSFRWQNMVSTEQEWVLSLKTDRSLFEEIVFLIQALHRYDVPEIIGTDVTEISQSYRDWMIDELQLT